MVLASHAIRAAPEDLPTIFRYPAETFGAFDEDALRMIVRDTLPGKEQEMMSQFAQENIRIGEQRGRMKERQEMLLEMVTLIY